MDSLGISKGKRGTEGTRDTRFQTSSAISRSDTWSRTELIDLRIKSKYILGIAVLVLAGIAGWQLASCEIANLELQEDLRDIAAQLGPRVGYDALSSDDDIRKAVIRKASNYDIDLAPEQITLQHTGFGKETGLYLAVDYKVVVKIPWYSFTMHFTPSNAK